MTEESKTKQTPEEKMIVLQQEYMQLSGRLGEAHYVIEMNKNTIPDIVARMKSVNKEFSDLKDYVQKRKNKTESALKEVKTTEEVVEAIA